MSVIKIKRGDKNDLPASAQLGEPLYASDTGELFIGNGAELGLTEVGHGKADKITGDISSGSFSASNDVSSPANVTGFAFSNSVVRAFDALVSVEVDATTDLFEAFKITGIQKSSSWSVNVTSVGDDSLFDFSITSAGQIQYTSGDHSGFSSAKVKFRATVTPIG